MTVYAVMIDLDAPTVEVVAELQAAFADVVGRHANVTLLGNTYSTREATYRVVGVDTSDSTPFEQEVDAVDAVAARAAVEVGTKVVATDPTRII